MHRSAATALLKRTYLKLAYPPSPPCHAVIDLTFDRAPHGGIGVVEIRPLNLRTLGAQYFHVDRASGHFSSEHTF